MFSANASIKMWTANGGYAQGYSEVRLGDASGDSLQSGEEPQPQPREKRKSIQSGHFKEYILAGDQAA